MPKVVRLTETFAVVECEYLTGKARAMEMRRTVCEQCGIWRDAEKRGVALACLHPKSPHWDVWLKITSEKAKEFLQKRFRV